MNINHQFAGNQISGESENASSKKKDSRTRNVNEPTLKENKKTEESNKSGNSKNSDRSESFQRKLRFFESAEKQEWNNDIKGRCGIEI